MSFDPIAPHETDHINVGVIKLDQFATTSSVDSVTVPGEPGMPVDPSEPIGGGGPGWGGGGGGSPPSSMVNIDAMKLIEALKSIPWGQVGITANELILKATDGYHGEKIDTNTLMLTVSANGVAVYSGEKGFYGDRDGNGVIDTGILYNPQSGILSADFNCDGVGDQVLAHF